MAKILRLIGRVQQEKKMAIVGRERDWTWKAEKNGKGRRDECKKPPSRQVMKEERDDEINQKAARKA